MEEGWKRFEVTLIAIVMALLASASIWPLLPDPMPTGWNAAGLVTSSMSKRAGVLLIPALMSLSLFIPAAVVALMRAARWTSEEVDPRDSMRLGNVLAMVLLFGLLVFHGALLLRASGSSIDTYRVKTMLFALSLIPIGNLFSKLRRNFFIGIRTPWSLADGDVWLRTQRFGGRLTMLVGFLSAAVILAGGPLSVSVWLMRGLAIACIAYSWWIYRQQAALANAAGTELAKPFQPRSMKLLALMIACAVLLLVSRAARASETVFDVEREGFKLVGVLDSPEGKGPFPVVLILPGSGPTDADGNSHLAPESRLGLHNSSTKQLAEGLNAAGYAVARINKRGLPPSTGEGNGVTEEEYADDYLAVLTTLRGMPTIDGKRVVIAGRSEGGPIAMLMAPRSNAAGFIFIESPGQRLTAVTTDQVLTQNRAHGATPEQLAKLELLQNGFYEAIAKAPDGQPMEYNGKAFPSAMVGYLRSVYALDPAALAKQIKAPSLVIQGTQDFNVAPENGQLLAAALPHGTLVMIEGMSHVLTEVVTRDPSQLSVPSGTPLHPKVIPAIVTWLNANIPRAP